MDRFPARGCIVLAVLVGLMGCSSQQKVTQQGFSQQSAMGHIRIDSAASSSLHIMQQVGSRVVQVEWTHTVYDTSAPVNPDTGLHPVRTQSRAVSRIEQRDSTHTSQRTDSAGVAVTTTQAVSHTEAARQQQVQKHRPGWLLQGAVAILLFMGLSLAVYRFLRIPRR